MTAAMLTLAVALAVINIIRIQAEVYSSFAHLERSLQAEQSLAKDIKDYIKQEKVRLEKLERAAEEYEQHSKAALANSESFMGNPINAYLFMKRFTTDWADLSHLLQEDHSYDLLANFEEIRNKGFLPQLVDLQGAAAALMRLQDTYNLNTSEIASGILQGVKRSPGLSAFDCFYFGKYAYNQSDYYHTLLWMQEALNRLPFEPDSPIDRITILDYLTFATFKQGNVRHALLLANEMLQIDPENERALQNKRYFLSNLEESDQPMTIENKRPHRGVRDEEYENYEKLCRGDSIKPFKTPKRTHKLTCSYETNKSPNLLLRPFKVEVLYHSPKIVMWHDVLSEVEMKKVKELATPRLNRATVHNPVTGKLEFAEYRVSKSVFLDSDIDPVVEVISQRIADITGLDMSTAEGLQVANYGMGGQYEPHFDFARRRETHAFSDAIGNRIATVLFYMTDVEAGGATVFPKLGVKVFPKKGSAAFWYNLRRSGIGDYRTRHAACPVLSGAKWVCNKWLHERGQELRRTCSTNPKE
ncbi:prolyl 4-hydroxylase subunit alpha-1 [Lingula anatina]|uniref:procollagen-proline 4-dioxygenase n=1 Tax=Lingula anatina TaxID=7574 RepID=A0A1S3IWT3_LINAN|nr:prolyl 4-hydroxylase subunit alpha-1 [Lingula anatina]|eukprot:XP_013402652.1 prolyl 4-hydroxylase subunit alpha-1 [Lingula anatina]